MKARGADWPRSSTISPVCPSMRTDIARYAPVGEIFTSRTPLSSMNGSTLSRVTAPPVIGRSNAHRHAASSAATGILISVLPLSTSCRLLRGGRAPAPTGTLHRNGVEGCFPGWQLNPEVTLELAAIQPRVRGPAGDRGIVARCDRHGARHAVDSPKRLRTRDDGRGEAMPGGPAFRRQVPQPRPKEWAGQDLRRGVGNERGRRRGAGLVGDHAQFIA